MLTRPAFVQGPYLVRSARVSGSTLVLRGDSIDETALEVFASKKVKSVTWNGKKVKTSKTPYGSLTASLEAPPVINLPSLASGTWKSQDSLPERLPSYDDSGPAWVGKSTLYQRFDPQAIPYTNHTSTRRQPHDNPEPENSRDPPGPLRRRIRYAVTHTIPPIN